MTPLQKQFVKFVIAIAIFFIACMIAVVLINLKKYKL